MPSPDFVIDPAAFAGCRGPTEPGCKECCEGPDGNGNCSVRFVYQGVGDETAYTAAETRSGPCPTSCQPCAACSLQDEEWTRELLTILQSRPECDCNMPRHVVDACIMPDSCACLCGVEFDLEICPPAR